MRGELFEKQILGSKVDTDSITELVSLKVPLNKVVGSLIGRGIKFRVRVSNHQLDVKRSVSYNFFININSIFIFQILVVWEKSGFSNVLIVLLVALARQNLPNCGQILNQFYGDQYHDS